MTLNKLVKKNLENILLDIDHTLVHTLTMDQFNEIPLDFMLQLDIVFFNNENINIAIILRPFVREFLHFLFQNYTVGIFTAGNAAYAEIIIEKIFNHNPVIALNSEDIIISQERYPGYKNLKYVYDIIPTFNKFNTIIIDDHPEVFDSNKRNCIKIKPFEVINENNIINIDCLQDKVLLHLFYYLTN